MKTLAFNRSDWNEFVKALSKDQVLDILRYSRKFSLQWDEERVVKLSVIFAIFMKFYLFNLRFYTKCLFMQKMKSLYHFIIRSVMTVFEYYSKYKCLFIRWKEYNEFGRMFVNPVHTPRSRMPFWVELTMSDRLEC